MEAILSKTEQPVVSIITPTYNSGKYIAETINSVLCQSYKDWEMIIVDDFSTDNTVQIIQQFLEKENRIRLVQLQENEGPGVARNYAIEQANGRYLAFLDADDLWYPEKLEKQLEFMRKFNIAFSFTKYSLIDEDGRDTHSVVDIPEKINYKQLLKQNVIGCLTVMLDTNITGKVKMESIRSRQDFVLWLSLCKKGITPIGLREVLAKYRITSKSLSSDKFKMAIQNWRVYRDIEKLDLLECMWIYLNYVFLSLKKYLINRK